MKLYIDCASTRRFTPSTQDGNRHYYMTMATDDRRAIVVCRDGLTLGDLAGQVVDAQVGWDNGTPGFVPDDEIGKRFTKVTVYRAIHGARAEKTLGNLLREAPRRPQQ